MRNWLMVADKEIEARQHGNSVLMPSVKIHNVIFKQFGIVFEEESYETNEGIKWRGYNGSFYNHEQRRSSLKIINSLAYKYLVRL